MTKHTFDEKAGDFLAEFRLFFATKFSGDRLIPQFGVLLEDITEAVHRVFVQILWQQYTNEEI